MIPPTVSAIAANATQPLGPLSVSYWLVRGGAACAVVIVARPSTPEVSATGGRRQGDFAANTVPRHHPNQVIRRRRSSAAERAIALSATDSSTRCALRGCLCTSNNAHVAHLDLSTLGGGGNRTRVLR